jgi:hypothetical protein
VEADRGFDRRKNRLCGLLRQGIIRAEKKYPFLFSLIPDNKMHTCRFWLKQSGEGVTIDAVFTLPLQVTGIQLCKVFRFSLETIIIEGENKDGNV